MANKSGERLVAVLPGDGTIKTTLYPVPDVEPGMVKISVKTSLVSPGTHLGGWDNLAKELADHTAPGEAKPIGYSAAGVIEEVGSGVKGFTKGQRVAAIGAGYAIHSNIIVVPYHLCIQIPDEVDFESASYAMLLATALHAVRRGAPVIGENWMVFGLGLLGLLTAKLLKINGCLVAGMDEHKTRVDLARDWLQDPFYLNSDPDALKLLRTYTRNQGFDGSVIAFGGEAETAMDQAVDLMKLSPDGHHEGTIVTVGWPKFSYDGLIGKMNNIDLRRASRTGPGYHDDQWERGEDYPHVFVRWSTRTNLQLCFEYLKRGMIDVKPLTTHRIPLESIDKKIPEILKAPENILGVLFTSN